MKINEPNNLNQSNGINNNQPDNQITYNIEKNNEQNININNNQNKEDDADDIDNLKYKDFVPQNSGIGPNLNQRLDSTDSPIAAQYKFSIDMPNVSKQRLHEYLNNDLLNALDVSPSISKLNSGLNPNISQNDMNNNNNPNNLFGFSLYPQANNQNILNQNNNFQNVYLNNNNYNNFNYNYSNDNPNYYQSYNNNYQNLAYNVNINNAKEFIPTKFRMNEQNNNNINNKKEIQTNPKNKFSNGNKKNKQKGKKFFEVREGDWRCNQCNNLNFSFRNKCNRCNLPKELSQSYEPLNPEMINQNQQFQMMTGMNNPNFVHK